MICTVLKSAAAFFRSSTSGYHVSRKKVRPIAPASYGDLSYIYYVRPDLKHPPESSWAHIMRPGTWLKIGCRLGLSSQACGLKLKGPTACLKSAPESIAYDTTNREHSRAVDRKVRSGICGPLEHQIDWPSHAARTSTKTAVISKSLLRTAPPAHTQ